MCCVNTLFYAKPGIPFGELTLEIEELIFGTNDEAKKQSLKSGFSHGQAHKLFGDKNRV